MRRAAVLLVLATLVACPSTPPDEEPPPPDRWVAGDLHVHSSGASNDTDGFSFPADIASVARQRGLDFVVLTDHSNSTGSMECADVEDCPNQGPEFPYVDEAASLSSVDFVLVDGNELSPVETLDGIGGPVGHTGCLPPADGFSFAGAFTDRPPGEVTGGEGLAQCQQIGGFAVVNHPFAGVPWIQWDGTSDAFDAMEVWNGTARWDRGDRRGLVSWECLTSRGRAVTPVAASDNHRVGIAPPGDTLNPPLGMPRTSVRVRGDDVADGLNWPAILAGLRRGDVVLHEEGTFVEGHGELVEAGAMWTATGRATVLGRVELRRIPANLDCDWYAPDEEAPHSEVVASADVAPGEFEVQLGPALDPNALLYLMLTRDDLAPTMDGDIAITGLLRLE